jgi:hypothetical protein
VTLARAFDRPGYSGSFMQRLATQTGGFTIARPRELAAGLTQIFRETGSYYLLGYEPANRADSKFRTLEVRVHRPDLLVRARNGYFPRPPDKGRRANDKPPAALAVANAGLLPAKDLPLRLAIAPFAIPGKSEAAVTIVAGVSRPAPDTLVTEDVSLLVQAFTPIGDRRGSVRRDARVALVPNAGDARFELRTRIDLKPGRYELRVAADSRTQSKSGSVYYSLDVPDFWKLPLSLSGIVVNVTPPVQGAQSAEVAAILPFSPTTQRELGAGHAASAFVRVYQGGSKRLAGVTVRMRILNEVDAEVAGATEHLGADRFGTTRTADYRFDLPAHLPPGDYVAIVEATAPGVPPVSRSVRFSRRQ